MKLPQVQATVVLPMNERGEVALARKKQPIHHGNGEISYSLARYNGYGGKKEGGDVDIFDTAIRELEAESSLVAKRSDLDLALRVYFYVLKVEAEEVVPFMEVFFFTLKKYEGVPTEGLEMGPPTFFEKSLIPYGEMMPADQFLFEKIFRGEKGVYQVVLKGKDSPPEIILLEEVL